MKQAAFGVLFAFLLVSPALADFSRWHGLTRASADHCQNGFEAQCCSDPLGAGSDIGWGEDTCSANTYGADPETCRGNTGVLYAPGRTAIVTTTYNGIEYGDVIEGSDAWVDIWVPDPSTLKLRYDLSSSGGPQPPHLLPSLEIAVFRYSGDPEALAGLGLLNVSVLINAGLLTHDDVMYTDTLVEEGYVDEVYVDLAGIPLEEVMILASGRGLIPPTCPPEDTPVPALGGRAAWILIGLALLASTAVLLRRGASRV
jgi:hypothetical protein